MNAPFRIGTRGSRLALWQANHVAERLRPFAGARPIELVEIETAGDRAHDTPLSQIGGDGLFTKAIQEALLASAVDVAVHSLKDLPTLPVAGLVLASVPERAASGDAFVSHRHRRFDDLPHGAVVATSSLRRRAQILHRRLDLQVVNMRGNVETRLRLLKEKELDGIILAQAGLERLGLADSITEILDVSWMLPAVGQGALGLECRAGDVGSHAFGNQLNDPVTHQAVLAERAFLRALGGGCLVPIGVHTIVTGSRLTLRGVVLAPDGTARVDGSSTGSLGNAEEVGLRLAGELLGRGAGELLSR
jgi:hydroxymethylbilane synthase